MKILNEVEFRKSLESGDTLILKHTRRYGDGTSITEEILRQSITEPMECTHAAVIELDGELGFECAIGGVFGRKA